MSGAFDPYRKWFGIPPEDQPPNHYRLLGIELFECDEEAIDNAATQRMAFVKYLKVVVTREEEPAGLLKGHPMFLLVLEVFLIIPLQRHYHSISQRLTKSMAYFLGSLKALAY